MKKLILFIITLILTISVNAQDVCISCIENKINYDEFASAMGRKNTAWGFCSLAVGEQNSLKGDYAVAMGKQNYSDGIASFAMGEKCKASANYSVAMGYMSEAKGMTSFAMGNNAYAGAESSFAFGFLVEATPSISFVAGKFLKATASETMILGSGTTDMGEIKHLTNNVFGTMMIGFNSDLPTFFVGRSSGMGTTGKIGIGNITAPTAKLHIRADATENASLFLEPADWNNKYALIKLGTSGHYIKADKNDGMTFKSGKDFLFLWDETVEGNVGIGIDDPDEKLEVNGNIQADEISVTGFTLNYGNPSDGQLLQYNAGGSASWIDPPETDDGDWTISENGVWTDGNVGVGMLPGGTKALEVSGDINLTGDLYKQGSLMDFTQWEENGNDLHYDAGNIGIGTGADDPDAPLRIKDYSGNVDKTILKIESSEEPGNGSTEIGREEGNGPVIIQRAGNINFNDGGPRLSFQQISETGEVGLSLSTYTKTTGTIKDVDLVAVNGGLYLRSLHDFHIKAGGNNPLNFYTQCTEGKSSGILRMEINSDGQVGIGTTIHMDQDTKLTVAGRIHAQEVKVTAGAGTGADFVFEEDYDLPNIEQVADYIRMHKHLPDIQSAAEMQEQGLDLGEMQIKLLQKIEELTLYVIDLKRENENIRTDNEMMKAEIEKLKGR